MNPDLIEFVPTKWRKNTKGNRPPHGEKVHIEGTINAHNWGETIAFCRLVDYNPPELCWFDDCKCTDYNKCNCDPIWNYDVMSWTPLSNNKG